MMQEQAQPQTNPRQGHHTPLRKAADVFQMVPRRAGRGASGHHLSETQIGAICAAMHLFVEDDLAKGLAADERQYCDACQRVRLAAGFVRYDRYKICNSCATEYEVANARGLALSAGQYVRDKRFGETGQYSLDSGFDG